MPVVASQVAALWHADGAAQSLNGLPVVLQQPATGTMGCFQLHVPLAASQAGMLQPSLRLQSVSTEQEPLLVGVHWLLVQAQVTPDPTVPVQSLMPLHEVSADVVEPTRSDDLQPAPRNVTASNVKQ